MTAVPTHTARFMCHTGPLPYSLSVSEISIRMKLNENCRGRAGQTGGGCSGVHTAADPPAHRASSPGRCEPLQQWCRAVSRSHTQGSHRKHNAAKGCSTQGWPQRVRSLGQPGRGRGAATHTAPAWPHSAAQHSAPLNTSYTFWAVPISDTGTPLTLVGAAPSVRRGRGRGQNGGV